MGDGSERGLFLAFEGPDGSGKTTQSRKLARRLDAVHTREPGDTPIGSQIRRLLLDPDATVCDRAEALLMAADRAQHVVELVRPALEAGRPVITDRYSASSVVYQGYGRGLAVDEVAELSRWATEGLQPDLVILLDVPVEVTLNRLAGSHDRLEALGHAFHERVRAGYHELAAADPDRWVTIGGADPIEVVARAVNQVVSERWPGRWPNPGAAPEPAPGPSGERPAKNGGEVRHG